MTDPTPDTQLDPRIREAFSSVRLDPALRARMLEQARPRRSRWPTVLLGVAVAATLLLVASPVLAPDGWTGASGLVASPSVELGLPLHDHDVAPVVGERVEVYEVDLETAARLGVAEVVSVGRRQVVLSVGTGEERAIQAASTANRLRVVGVDGDAATLSIRPAGLDRVGPEAHRLQLTIGTSTDLGWAAIDRRDGTRFRLRVNRDVLPDLLVADHNNDVQVGLNRGQAGTRLVTVDLVERDEDFGVAIVGLWAVTPGRAVFLGEGQPERGAPRTLTLTVDTAEALMKVRDTDAVLRLARRRLDGSFDVAVDAGFPSGRVRLEAVQGLEVDLHRRNGIAELVGVAQDRVGEVLSADDGTLVLESVR